VLEVRECVELHGALLYSLLCSTTAVQDVRACVELRGDLLCIYFSMLKCTKYGHALSCWGLCFHHYVFMTAMQEVRACVELLRACRRYIWSYCRVIHCLMLPMIAMQEVLAYV